MTVVMWEEIGEGTAAHRVQFVAATTLYSGTWAFSAAMSPANGKYFQRVPAPIIQSSNPVSGTTFNFTLRLNVKDPLDATSPFTTNANFRRQYYASAIGTPPTVVTDWLVYAYQGASAPTTGLIGGTWNLIGTVPIPDDAAAYVDWTTGNYDIGTNAVWFAVAPRFADGFVPFRTYGAGLNSNAILSAASAQVGPTAAGVFGPMSAAAQGYNINVSWTSNVETGVASYQVYSSVLAGGPFKAAGNPISPLGNGHAYNSSFTMPATKASGTVFVKVKATKTDASEEWSDVKKVVYGGGLGTAPVGGVPK